jgi:hypothetical protein
MSWYVLGGTMHSLNGTFQHFIGWFECRLASFLHCKSEAIMRTICNT